MQTRWMRSRFALSWLVVGLVLLVDGVPSAELEWEADFGMDVPVVCAATRQGAGTYVGSGERLFRLTEEGHDEVTRRAGHQVTALFVNPDGTVWAGWDDGIGRLAGEGRGGQDWWDWVTLEHGLVSGGYEVTERSAIGEIVAIGRTPLGVVAASVQHGLMAFAEYHNLWHTYWPHFWGPNSEWLDLRAILPDQETRCILEDDNGDVWLGTNRGLLLIPHAAAVYHQRKSGHYSGADNEARESLKFRRFSSHSHALPSNEVLCAATQWAAGTWFGFGGAGGVAFCELPGKRMGHFYSGIGEWTSLITHTGGHARTDEWQVTRPGEHGLPAGPVRSMAGDSGGRMWVAVDIRGSEPPQSKLACLVGGEWRLEPPPAGLWEEWPRIHQLLVTTAGELVLCTEAGVWTAQLGLAAERVVHPLAEPPKSPEDAETAVDLPPAAEVTPEDIYSDATELMAAVLERNRPWLLPPSETVDSLEYRFLIEGRGVEQRFRWERPYLSSLSVLWDSRGLVPDIVKRKWVTLDGERPWETAGDSGLRPIGASRLDGGTYLQDCLTGCELQTALRLYARSPDSFEVAMAEERPAGGEGAYAVALRRAEQGASIQPHVAPRLFMVGWDYALSGPRRGGIAHIHIDGRRLVPTKEEWLEVNESVRRVRERAVRPSYHVVYSDFRETPDGAAVPLRIQVGRGARDEDSRTVVEVARETSARPSFDARYAWYEPGVWLLAEATLAGEQSESKVVVRRVRVNTPTELAAEVGLLEEEILTRRARALDILTEVAARNSPWLSSALSPDFLETSYVFQLSDAEGQVVDDREVSVTAGEVGRWDPRLLGNTVTIFLAPVMQDPSAFSPFLAATVQEDGREMHIIRAEAEEPVGVACGNGIGGEWAGYFSSRWQTLEFAIDAESFLPIWARAGGREQRYGEFHELAPGKFAPLLVEVPGWFEYRFMWAADCLWIVRETVTRPEAEARGSRLIGLTVNGEPVAGVPGRG